MRLLSVVFLLVLICGCSDNILDLQEDPLSNNYSKTELIRVPLDFNQVERVVRASGIDGDAIGYSYFLIVGLSAPPKDTPKIEVEQQVKNLPAVISYEGGKARLILYLVTSTRVELNIEILEGTIEALKPVKANLVYEVK